MGFFARDAQPRRGLLSTTALINLASVVEKADEAVLPAVSARRFRRRQRPARPARRAQPSSSALPSPPA